MDQEIFETDPAFTRDRHIVMLSQHPIGLTTSSRTNCLLPVAGVSLFVFHTDAKGRYSNDTADNRVGEYNPRLRGLLRTDKEGRYRYETTRPGSYDNGAAHVHYIVNAHGYEPLLLELQFQDDPIVVAQLKTGKPSLDPVAFKNGPCKSRPDCVLTQAVTRDAQGVSHVIRDIQMVRQ